MIRPLQRLPKSKKNKEWIENCAKYFSSICIPAIDSRKADMLYRAANGELDEDDYLYVTNPRNATNPKHTRFPSKIRNFDIISPTIMQLMGEKRRRGLDYTTVAINSDIDDLRKEMLDGLINQYLTQELINEVINQQIAAGQEPNMEQTQQLTVEAIHKKVSKLQDKLAIEGQNVIDYIREYVSLDSKFAESAYHFFVTARTFTFKQPKNDEVEFEIVSPKEMYYHANSRITFIKDAEATKRRAKWPVGQVIDNFQNVDGFTKEIADRLENKIGSFGEGFSTSSTGKIGLTERDYLGMDRNSMTEAMVSKVFNSREEDIYDDEDGISVEHIVWTSEVKVGKIKVPNMFGEEETMWVDEDFIAIDEEIEWEWKPQKWEAWIIDDCEIVGGGAIEYTTSDVNKCESPYNGRILNVKHTNPKSIVDKLLPFQVKNNVIHYYIEKTIAKNKDKITVFPLGLLPEDKNIDMEAAMYYADAMGFLFVDETKGKNVQAALNAIKTIDAGLSQHLNMLFEYLRLNIDMADAVIGNTPARKGQMNSSDGKGVTENSVFRSSIMTEELFIELEELEETDLNGLIELGKIAFAEGKKAVFIRGVKNEQALLNVDTEKFSFGKYLIKVKRAGKNLQDLEVARAQAQALTQNKDGRFSDVLKVLRAGNISELIEEMENVEVEFEQKQQAQQQAQQQMQLQSDQLKLQTAETNERASNYRADRMYEATVDSATIKSEGTILLDKFNNPDTAGADLASLEANNIKREELRQKDRTENRKLDVEQKKAALDADTKKYVVDKQVAIARENKQK